MKTDMREYRIAYGWKNPGARPGENKLQELFVKATSRNGALANARRQLRAEWRGDPAWKLETIILTGDASLEAIIEEGKEIIMKQVEQQLLDEGIIEFSPDGKLVRLTEKGRQLQQR